MANKNISQIAYLMELLDISTQELAAHLQIARTTVSKWRTGARKLPESSPHYEQLIDYLVSKNSSYSHKPLHSLFKMVYTFDDHKENTDMRSRIRNYLGGDSAADVFGNFLYEHKKALYQTSVSVFRGIEGRKNAVSLIFDIAESFAEPCHIRILDQEQFEWLSRDMTYMQRFIDRLYTLSKNGHTIDLCFTINNDTNAFRNFTALLPAIAFSKNISIGTMISYYHTSLCIYAVDNKIAAIGLNATGKMPDLHTAVYSDKLSTEEYIAVFDKLKHALAQETVMTDTDAREEKLIQKIKSTISLVEPIYYSGRLLSITTASEDLLADIIEHNELNKLEAQRCFDYYYTMRDSMFAGGENSKGVYLLCHNRLRDALSFDSLIQYELTSVVKRPVQKTGLQYRKHLKILAEKVLNDKNLNISLVPNISFPDSIACAYIKANAWGLLFNSRTTLDEYSAYLMQNLTIIKRSVDDCIEISRKYPVEFSERKCVADILCKLYNDE